MSAYVYLLRTKLMPYLKKDVAKCFSSYKKAFVCCTNVSFVKALVFMFPFADGGICPEYAGRRQGVDLHRQESYVSVGGLGRVPVCRC